MSPPDLRRQKVATTGTGVDGSGGFGEGRVKEVVLDGVGHLVPMIAPGKSAFAAAGFLAGELGRWRGEEEEWRGGGGGGFGGGGGGGGGGGWGGGGGGGGGGGPEGEDDG